MSKYGNKKVAVDGIKFDSKMEADYYRYLCNMKFFGKIVDFEIKPKFILQPSFKYHGSTIRAITYTPDFKVYKKDSIDLIDVKGAKTNEFKLKEKMLKYLLKDDEKYNMYCLTLRNETWVKI